MLGTTTTTTTTNNSSSSSSQTNNNMNLVICSTTNYQQYYWPQNQQIIIDEKKSSSSSSSTLMMASSSSSPPILMEKSNPQQQQELHQQLQSLKCPRCDSSNTKFCYYNNYSLSQPRHFCKACKRYWTRGGTLRNVPVGGGCRKNKRLNNKRPTPSSISTLDNNNNNNNSSPNSSSSNPNPNPIINTPPLFYGLPTTDPTHLNLPYQNFNSRVSVSGYGGLGFSSGLMDYSSPGGFNPKEIQEVVNSSTSLLSRYPIFGSTTNLLQQQQKFMGGLVPNYEDMQMMGSSTINDVKEVKMEDSQNRLNWSSLSTQMDQIGSSDPSLLWLDPSVPSLI